MSEPISEERLAVVRKLMEGKRVFAGSVVHEIDVVSVGTDEREASKACKRALEDSCDDPSVEIREASADGRGHYRVPYDEEDCVYGLNGVTWGEVLAVLHERDAAARAAKLLAKPEGGAS